MFKSNSEEERVAHIQVFTRTFGIVLTIVFLSLSFLDEFAGEKGLLTETQRVILAVAGALIGISVERAGDVWSNLFEQKRSKKTSNEFILELKQQSDNVRMDVSSLREAIQNSYNVEIIGNSPQKVHNLVADLATNASKIRNTFVNIHDSDESEDGTVEIYNNFLGKGGRWYDIVSINELFSPRFKKINPLVESGRNSINLIKYHHEIVVLKHSIPVLNFTIFDYAETRSTEVLFGWAGGRQHGNHTVFRTNDRNMVLMFEKLFLNMWENRRLSHIVVDYDDASYRLKSQASRVVIDKIGYWYTHGYIKDKDGNFDRKTTALFKIEFVGGRPIVEGIVAAADANAQRQYIDHRHEDLVEHSGGKIYIEYSARHGSTISEGFVFYKFKSIESEDTISGFAIDNFYDDKLYIIGIRVQASDRRIDLDFLRETHENQSKKVENIWGYETGAGGPQI